MFALGDALATTDFRVGLGTNKGIFSALQVLKHDMPPETLRVQLAEHCYFDKPPRNLEERQLKEKGCRNWMLKLQVHGPAALQLDAKRQESAALLMRVKRRSTSDLERFSPPSQRPRLTSSHSV